MKSAMAEAGTGGRAIVGRRGSRRSSPVRTRAGAAAPDAAAAVAPSAASASASTAAAVAPQPADKTCAHANVVRAEDEIVCTSCGMVIDDDDAIAAMHGSHNDAAANSSLPQSWGGADSESKPNLYVSNVLGSANAIPKMPGMQLLNLYCKGGLETSNDRRKKTRLSKFSNACEKMRFTAIQAQTAWSLFQRAAKSSSPRKSAEVAAWAIYKTCQMYSIPATSDEILSVVKSNFSRKSMPNMIRILYECMVSSEESLAAASAAAAGAGGNAADGHADAEGGRPGMAAGSGGAVGASAGGRQDYYFALNLRRMLKGRRYTKDMFAGAKNDAWRLYHEVFKTGNPNTRARRSIAMAFGLGS